MASALLFRGGEILLGDRAEKGLAVCVEGTRITALGAEALRRGRRKARGLRRIDLQGAMLCPGFIDLHTHGAAGVDFFTASPQEIRRAVREFYLPHGVTRLLASLCPGPKAAFLDAIRRIAAAAADEAVGLGVAAGIHLEGPFLDPGHPGALPGRHFKVYRPDLLDEYLRAGGGKVRTMTVAPERPGGLKLIRHLLRRGVTPAFGHSGAGYDEARQSIRAGIRYVTHLFNAMDGIHHRRPGPVSAFLEDDRVSTELISDGFHIDPAVLRWVARIKPVDRICLVSDSVGPCGMKDGRYRFAGAEVELRRGRVTLTNGTLAGSALTLDQAFRVQVRSAGNAPWKVSRALSAVPAIVVGWRQVGEISAGKRADLVVLSGDFRVQETYLAGSPVYSRKA